MSSAIQITGATIMVIGVFMLSVPAGIILAGAITLLVGISLGQ